MMKAGTGLAPAAARWLPIIGLAITLSIVSPLSAPLQAQDEPAQCRTVKKFKGDRSIDVRLCRGADGVFREEEKEIGASRGGFRGRVSYVGEYSGTAQRATRPRRVQLNLNTLLQQALRGGESKNEIRGDTTLQLDFTGASVQGTVSGGGATRFSFRLDGYVQDGQCTLVDPSQTVRLEGQCNADGFLGTLETDPQYGTKLRLNLAAGTKSVVDFDERDLTQAAARAEREAKLARERESEARWVEGILLKARAGDVESMLSMGAIYDGSAKTQFVRRDYGEAASWYGQAARVGDPSGMYSLAFMHYDGTLGRQDFAAALDLFTRCAAKKWKLQVHCHEVAGALHYQGQGTPQDTAKAVSHWRSCAALGDNDCTDKLNRLGR